MTADLIILGAGIAGLSAALGACDRGAIPLLLDAGEPPEAGRRHDLLIDADFVPVGGPLPTAVTWACTRILGLAAGETIHRLHGHVIDREALRQHLLAQALGRGAVVRWRTAAAWDGIRASAPARDLPDVPVLLASSAFLPVGQPAGRRIRRVWQGTGTPLSSYVVAPVSQENGNLILAMTGSNRWSIFGWQADEAAPPTLPPGAELTFERACPVAPASTVLSGATWLRLGGAAGLEPAHGFGLVARLALSRSTGWLAAEWTLTGAAAEAWASYGGWLAPYRHWLHACSRLVP
jgi:hypothetical protein